MRRKLLYRSVTQAASAPIAISLMVAMVVALTSVVAVFVLGLVDLPEDPPTISVLYTDVNGRWTIHVEDVSEEFKFSDFKIVARHENGELVQYDPDGDSVPDRLLAVDLSDLVRSSGGGPQSAPISFVDVDGDGRVSSADIMVVQSIFIPDTNLLSDGTRAHKKVSLAPHGIPLDSDLVVVASSSTLAAANIKPGDAIKLEIKHGGNPEATRLGNAGAGGSFVSTVHLDPAWPRGNHKAVFTVRPGEVDQWDGEHLFKVVDPDPLTPAEEDFYELLERPLQTGDVVSLVYKPTNAVVLEFRL